MIIVIRPHSSKEQIEEVIREVEVLGYTPAPIHGTEQTVVAAIGDERTHQSLESLGALPQVESVLRVQKRYKLVSRESRPTNTLVDVAGVEIGGSKFCLMAGPCSVESEEQLLATAEAVKGGRGHHPARRRLQAAHLALSNSRAWARKDCGCSRWRGKRPA